MFNKKELNGVIKNYSIDNLIDFFRSKYSKELSMSVGVWEGYSLEDHVRMVLNQFDKYFSHRTLPCRVSNTFLRILIVLHDIGKPAAIEKGNKRLQHKETLKIVKPILRKLEFSVDEIKLALALISDDPIGPYLRFGDPKNAVRKIIKMSESTNCPLEQFFQLLLIYFKCDAGSYTKDAGGKKSLDCFFIFSHKNKTLNFCKDYENKINILSNLLFPTKDR